MTRLRGPLVAIGVALMAFGASIALGVAPTSAQETPVNYNVSADASSLLMELQFPDADLVVGSDLVNATPTRALAAVDTIGTSQAFASAGYPGDIPFTLPSTLTGVLSGFDGAREVIPLLPPVPEYPLAAQSDLANPSSSTESGAFAVSAQTSESESVADALLGADQLGATAVSAHSRATATFDNETSTARSEALAETSGLRLAGVLDLSQRTTGTISVTPGGTPTMSTQSFFGASLVGSEVQVGFGPDGLTAAGNTLVDQVAVQSTLTALSAAGIEIEYLPKSVGDDGSSVTSAGVRISQTFTVPDEAAFVDQLGLPFSADVGRVIASVTFGQVNLSADVSTFEIPSFGGNEPSTPIDDGGGTAPITTSAPVDPGPADSGLGSGSESSATPTTPPKTTAPSPNVVPSQPSSLGREPDVFSSSSFYLVLVGAAVAALGSSRLLGNLAIRLRFAA